MWVVAGRECPIRTGIRQKQLALLGGALWGRALPLLSAVFLGHPHLHV